MRDFDQVYLQLKRLAHRELARHAPSTLDTTALVHEAYVKLSEYGASADDRQHLVNLVVRTMRQILTDAGRRRSSLRHGGDLARTELADDLAVDDAALDAAAAVVEAVDRIKAAHQRMGQVVEMHFFGGIEFGDIAELLAVDRRTVYRDWVAARSLLAAELQPG
jgi:RNA polymerase sigma factor (TIGR02999 family)